MMIHLVSVTFVDLCFMCIVQLGLQQLGRQLDNQQNVTDPAARVTAQADALRNGVLLQNLGAYFLELGRTVTTLRLGRSPVGYHFLSSADF